MKAPLTKEQLAEMRRVYSPDPRILLILDSHALVDEALALATAKLAKLEEELRNKNA